MTVRAYEHELGPNQSLIADLRSANFPLGWAAEVPSGVELTRDFSSSPEPGNWLTPATYASITESVTDVENYPAPFLRWRHASGTDAATIRISTTGRVTWKVSS